VLPDNDFDLLGHAARLHGFVHEHMNRVPRRDHDLRFGVHYLIFKTNRAVADLSHAGPDRDVVIVSRRRKIIGMGLRDRKIDPFFLALGVGESQRSEIFCARGLEPISDSSRNR